MNETLRSFKRSASCISLINHKDDEKQLSESLYRNLHVLQRFMHASPHFLEIYEQHMFMKPNTKAFFHAFHFIFNCLDAEEFNKRFHWPIYGKVNETWFRNCTVNYINHLNAVHQLGFETLKLHHIYTAGGFKFIKIVHKLSYLAMNLILKEHKGSIPNVNNIPDANDQLAKLEETIDDSFDFVARLQAQSKMMCERTDEMNKMMMSFFQESRISVTDGQCWSCLAELWRNQLDLIVENDVKPQLERVGMVSKICADFEQDLTKLLVDRKANTIEYDKANLVIAQNILVRWNPDLQQAIVGMVRNNSINFDNLLQVFDFVLPMIMEKLENFEFRDLEAIQYESDQIDVLDARASHVQNEMSDFEKNIRPFLKKNKERFHKFCLNVPYLPFSVIQTPVVVRKIDYMRQRFALMNDDYATRVKLFNETLPSKSRTINKYQNANATGCSSLMQSNKARNDAVQILLKNKTLKANSSQSVSNISHLSNVCSPKFSSAICSTAIKIYEHKYHENELQISPVFPNAQPTRARAVSKNIVESATFSSPNPISRRIFFTNSAFHLNHTDLRGSPSRRWEISDNITDAHQNFVPTPLNGNNDQEEAIKNVIATLNEEEFLENVSDSIVNNLSN